MNFKSVKCPESGKEKNRTFENSRTTGTRRDVRLSPNTTSELFNFIEKSDLRFKKKSAVNFKFTVSINGKAKTEAFM